VFGYFMLTISLSFWAEINVWLNLSVSGEHEVE